MYIDHKTEIPMACNLTIRISDSTKNQLKKLAKTTKKSESTLVNKAIKNYLELEKWQIKKIKQGIKEAKQGLFASEEEVERAFLKWQKI